jgi:multidrug transporter EmrE-like cation transporter
MGSNELVQNGIEKVLTDYWLIGGYGCYAVSALLFIIALKHGELSVLYPIIASTYVWVTFLSPMFFPTDSINWLKIAGVLCIVGGVTTIGIGANK